MNPVTPEDLLSDEKYCRRFQMNTRTGHWGCTEWSGARRNGYGICNWRGRHMLAHRAAWMMHHNKSIPPKMTIDHLCCNKGCVNPLHLDVVTHEENSLRITRPVEGWVPIGGKYGLRRKQPGVLKYPKKAS